MGAAFGGVKVAVFSGGFEHELAQRHRFTDADSKAFMAMLADIAVGVVLCGQKQKFDGAHVGRKGQGSVQRLARSAPACAVAIKTKNHRVGKAKQLLHMLCSARCTQRGYRVGKAKLRQSHHVHVAFGDQCVAFLTKSGAGFKQAVQLPALAEHRSLG